LPAPKTEAKIIADFEKLGPDGVRLWLATSQPQGPASAFLAVKRNLAIDWLAKFDQETRLRNDASQAESLEIARSAKDAAWEAASAAREAAKEARTANEIAKTARLIAILATIASAGIPIIAALL
jgi:hypothetical protein